jgi:hypothetical protein
VLALTAVLRLPAFRYGVISDDEAIYDAMARVITSGGVMYRDTVDHKPPGLAYTYAAVRAVAPGDWAMPLVHVLGLGVAAATAAAIYAVARRLGGAMREHAGAAAILYAAASTTMQPVDGLAVNGELMMNLPTVLAVWAVLAARAAPRWRASLIDLAAGALVGGAALYKYQAAIVLVAFVALVPRPRALAAWIVGAALPLAVAALSFARAGALADAVRWGLRFNASYLADGAPLGFALERLALQLAGVVLPSGLVWGAALVSLWRLGRAAWGQRGWPAPTDRLLMVWAAGAVFCVGLGGRFYGHYFLQPLPVLVLLAAAPIARALERRPRATIAAVAAPALFFLAVAALPEHSRPILNSGDPDIDTIAQAVRRHARPDQSIWVWGNVPQIYHAADRTPGVRFSFCNYLTGLSPATPSEYDPTVDPSAHIVTWAWPMVAADIASRRPAVIVDTAPGDIKGYGKFPARRYPVLAGILAADYVAVEEIAGAVIYARLE